MTTLYFTHTLATNDRCAVIDGAKTIDLKHTLDAVETNRVLAEVETQLLIDNLVDRGFTILASDQVEEIEEIIEGGNILESLIHGLNGSIKQRNGNDDLTLKLIEAIIFTATGEATKVEFHIEEDAA